VSNVPASSKPEKVMAPPSVEADPPAEAPASPATQVVQTELPDDLGGSSFEKAAEEKTGKAPAPTGHVRKCRKTNNDMWYFYFDNGQQWKQSGQGSYRFKECDFYATISKDRFGYKMKIEGGKTVRVKRVK